MNPLTTGIPKNLWMQLRQGHPTEEKIIGAVAFYGKIGGKQQ